MDCNRVALPLEAHEPRSAFTASNQDVSHTFCCCCCFVCFVFNKNYRNVSRTPSTHNYNAYCVYLINFLFGFSLLMLRNARDRYGLHPRPSNHFTALLLETILNQSPVSCALIILGFSVLNCGCIKLWLIYIRIRRRKSP